MWLWSYPPLPRGETVFVAKNHINSGVNKKDFSLIIISHTHAHMHASIKLYYLNMRNYTQTHAHTHNHV